MSWLLMMTRSRALDALRRQDEAVLSEDPHALVGEPDSARDDPADMLEAFDRASATRRALEQLPPNARQLPGLAFFRGLTHAEIVKETGMPLGSVKTTIRRAMVTLKTLLGDCAPGFRASLCALRDGGLVLPAITVAAAAPFFRAGLRSNRIISKSLPPTDDR